MAENIRMNTFRVSLHDLLWQDDNAARIYPWPKMLRLRGGIGQASSFNTC